MPWLDTLAIENWELVGTDPINLDTTGPESVDVSVVLDRPEKTTGPVTITTDKNLSLRGVNYGDLVLINSRPDAFLSLSGDLVLIGGTVDDSQFEGTLQTNGFRFITQPYLDVLDIPNWVLYGDGPFDFDFTGSKPHRNEFWITLDNPTGNVSVNTGKKDTLAGVEFDNTVTVHLAGKTVHKIILLGAGTVRANNLESGRIDRENFTGTWITENVIERIFYTDMGYTEMTFVAFEDAGQYTINQTNMVQDVRAINFAG